MYIILLSYNNSKIITIRNKEYRKIIINVKTIHFKSGKNIQDKNICLLVTTNHNKKKLEIKGIFNYFSKPEFVNRQQLSVENECTRRILLYLCSWT